jgi:excisionase family DNA binding protein
MTDDTLTAKEAAAMLLVTEDTIRDYARQGYIPGVFLGVWRFSRSALASWMSEPHPRGSRGAPHTPVMSGSRRAKRA